MIEYLEMTSQEYDKLPVYELSKIDEYAVFKIKNISDGGRAIGVGYCFVRVEDGVKLVQTRLTDIWGKNDVLLTDEVKEQIISEISENHGISTDKLKEII